MHFHPTLTSSSVHQLTITHHALSPQPHIFICTSIIQYPTMHFHPTATSASVHQLINNHALSPQPHVIICTSINQLPTMHFHPTLTSSSVHRLFNNPPCTFTPLPRQHLYINLSITHRSLSPHPHVIICASINIYPPFTFTPPSHHHLYIN